MSEIIIEPFDERLRDASFCIAFGGEGAYACVVHGWKALISTLLSEQDGMGLPPDEVTQESLEDWLGPIIDDDEWGRDEGGVPYWVSMGIGEISDVAIYRLCEGSRKP